MNAWALYYLLKRKLHECVQKNAAMCTEIWDDRCTHTCRGLAVGRPKQLPEGKRVALTIAYDLLETLETMAAQRDVPMSIVAEDLLRRGLQGPIARGEDPNRELPKGWTGRDLRKRMIDLRMRQKDLAEALTQMLHHTVTKGTVSDWMLGKHSFPEWSRHPIEEVLMEWDPDTNKNYRIGSRSPIE